MIKIVGQGRLDFGEAQITILSGDLLSRPSAVQVVRYDHSHPGAGLTFQAGRRIRMFQDVRICQCERRAENFAGSSGVVKNKAENRKQKAEIGISLITDEHRWTQISSRDHGLRTTDRGT